MLVTLVHETFVHATIVLETFVQVTSVLVAISLEPLIRSWSNFEQQQSWQQLSRIPPSKKLLTMQQIYKLDMQLCNFLALYVYIFDLMIFL